VTPALSGLGTRGRCSDHASPNHACVILASHVASSRGPANFRRSEPTCGTWKASEAIRQRLDGIVLRPDGWLNRPDEGLDGFDRILRFVHPKLHIVTA
jgi:hypothetical protein